MSDAELKEAFGKFATKGNGKEATSKDVTKWFTDAGVLDKKKLTSQSLDIAFTKVKPKGKQTLTEKEISALIDAFGSGLNIDDKNAKIVAKLANASPKGHGTTKTSKTGGVDKMTDTSQYTGAHKQRFDESGKGTGIDGREDRPEASGYVSGYKNQDTYEK